MRRVRVPAYDNEKAVELLRNGQFDELKELDRPVDEAWAKVYNVISDKMQGTASWCTQRSAIGRKLMYVLHPSTRDGILLQLSCILVKMTNSYPYPIRTSIHLMNS